MGCQKGGRLSENHRVHIAIGCGNTKKHMGRTKGYARTEASKEKTRATFKLKANTIGRMSVCETQLAEALTLLNLKPVMQLHIQFSNTRTYVDIAFPKVKLAVYCDGWSHSFEDVKARDAKIDANLRVDNWTVLRFSNEQIKRDIDTCIEAILNEVSRLTSTTPLIEIA